MGPGVYRGRKATAKRDTQLGKGSPTLERGKPPPRTWLPGSSPGFSGLVPARGRGIAATPSLHSAANESRREVVAPVSSMGYRESKRCISFPPKVGGGPAGCQALVWAELFFSSLEVRFLSG